LLVALADNATGTDDLISEVSLRSDQIGLRLEPSGNHGAVPVQMGSTNFTKKLKRLRAFWYQNMVPGQNTRFESIDLRYDSQIVAREATE
jgi:cell division protein FtsQ